MSRLLLGAAVFAVMTGTVASDVHAHALLPVMRRGTRSSIVVRVVALGLCCMAVATTANYQSAKAVNDQSLCFDTWTTLDAGGPVSDEALAAAQNACVRLQQSAQDSLSREKIRRALVAITEEAQRRHAPPR